MHATGGRIVVQLMHTTTPTRFIRRWSPPWPRSTSTTAPTNPGLQVRLRTGGR
ncbi:hypothetical protein [Nonomuraea gerenzanensis]|uniref:Uncharacterized protein n=1 Tax=Nonomuraea gerenzanensis TaxID=93944 RepID=A0A1M4EQB9_9ACTN|nr:hypothetical protein [Nonomuraea gerenzanensis]UBU12258.1 hypothetical protein LCN96_49590 [Nonomuraea gerenzanensis]SBP00793.1 hypothetical protein BN4615_P10309 [Nonomuraea gerenzanensis]